MTGGSNIHFILIIPQITPSNLKASPGKISLSKIPLSYQNHKVGLGTERSVPEDSLKLPKFMSLITMITGVSCFLRTKSPFASGNH